MHGRKRQPARAMSTEEQSQIDSYIKHKNMALAAHRKKQVNAATMTLTSKQQSINPDFYTQFNFRKQQVLSMLSVENADIVDIWRNELELSSNALKKQPKSYYAWYHRQWVVLNAQGYVDLSSEMKLTSTFLLQDLRNFHCWNYRRFQSTAAMGAYTAPMYSPAEKEFMAVENINQDRILCPFTELHASPESELLQTSQCISTDVSNYSAWHSRTLQLPCVFFRSITGITDITEYNTLLQKNTEYTNEKSPTQPFLPLQTNTEEATLYKLPYTSQYTITKVVQVYFDILCQELDLVRVATTMTPSDQSPWLYYRWLLAMLVDMKNNPVIESFVDSHLQNNVFSKTLGPDCTIVPSLSVFFHNLSQQNEQARIALQTMYTFLILQEAEYLSTQQYMLEPESPQVQLGLQLLKHCLHQVTVQCKQMSHDNNNNNTNTTPVSREEMQQYILDTCTGSNDPTYFAQDANICNEHNNTINNRLLYTCSNVLEKLHSIDCIALLLQHDSLRKGFYLALQRLLEK